MNPRAGQSKNNGHFYHININFCPTKKASTRPYLGLEPTIQDQNAKLINRQFARDNISQIFFRLQKIVPFFDFLEFIKILDEAKRLNCYSYVDLDPEYLPYIYVTLINFLPSKGRVNAKTKEKRQLKFYFFYDAKIQTYEDLWKDRGNFSDLIRISYKDNKPCKVSMIETTTEYLNNDKALTKKQLKWCNDIM